MHESIGQKSLVGYLAIFGFFGNDYGLNLEEIRNIL